MNETTVNNYTSCVGDPTLLWDVVVLDATIAAQKANGDSWDVSNGLPDPTGRVYLVSGGGDVGQEFLSVQDNTLHPDWGGETTLRGVPGSKFNFVFKFHLWDDDILGNDYIGNCPVGTYGRAPVDFSGNVLECTTAPDLANGEAGFSIRYRFVPHAP